MRIGELVSKGWLGTFAVSWYLATAGSVAAQSGTFTFAPPDGTVVETEVKVVREQDDPAGNRMVQTSIVRNREAYEALADGTALTQTRLDATTTRNRVPVPSPVFDIMAETVIRYDIGADGRVRGVSGFETLPDKIHTIFAPDMAAVIAPSFNEQALVTKAIEDWDRRTGNFVGQSAERGSVMRADLIFPLPNGGVLPYQAAHIVTEVFDCPTGRCVLIETIYDSESETAERRIAEKLAIVTGTSDAVSAATDPASRLTGWARRVIDPATMLTYEETQHRAINITIEVPGMGGMTLDTVERRYYAYDYK